MLAMMIIYRILADAVVLVHWTFVLFVMLGLVAILVGRVRGWRWTRNLWFRGAHLCAIAVVVAQAWAGVVCPLTSLENELRRRAGEAAYPGSFIAYWAHELLFFESPAWVFTLLYTVFGLAVLASFVWAPPRWR